MSTSMPAAAPKKPRPRWQKVALIVVGVVVALIIIGALFGPKKSDAPAASSTSSSASSPAVTTASSDQTTASSEPSTSGPGPRPKPTDAQVREVGIQLAAIQPEMAELKVTHIESWSDSMCADIWAGEIQDLAGRAVQRFAGGDRPALSQEQGQQIVDAITTTYCHP